MKKFNVSIHMEKYMQHRMDSQKLEVWEKNRKQIIERDDVALEDLTRAEFHCYRNGNSKCFIPSEHVKQCLTNGGTQVKSKMGNSRKSMTNIVAGLFSVTPEHIEIRDFDTIDKRSAVNHNVKGRIIVVRPRWDNLDVSFTINVKNDTITKETVREILDQSGVMFGIGSYRPEHKGEFGVFEVTKFEEVKEK
jgi:hypothetical protein